MRTTGETPVPRKNPWERRAQARRAIVMGDTAFLGIDCGTGKVAVAVIDAAGRQLHAASQPHAADLPTAAGRHEQDAERIIACAEALVRAIPTDLRARIAGIGFTGQMHGVVLHDADSKPLSPLVTWQDQ